MFELPQKKETIPPSEGWKPSTWYLIDVSYGPSNPVHRGMLYTGFLNGPNNTPGGYSHLQDLNGSNEDGWRPYGRQYYLKALKIVVTEEDSKRGL